MFLSSDWSYETRTRQHLGSKPSFWCSPATNFTLLLEFATCQMAWFAEKMAWLPSVTLSPDLAMHRGRTEMLQYVAWLGTNSSHLPTHLVSTTMHTPLWWRLWACEPVTDAEACARVLHVQQ